MCIYKCSLKIFTNGSKEPCRQQMIIVQMQAKRLDKLYYFNIYYCIINSEYFYGYTTEFYSLNNTYSFIIYGVGTLHILCTTRRVPENCNKSMHGGCVFSSMFFVSYHYSKHHRYITNVFRRW